MGFRSPDTMMVRHKSYQTCRRRRWSSQGFIFRHTHRRCWISPGSAAKARWFTSGAGRPSLSDSVANYVATSTFSAQEHPTRDTGNGIETSKHLF
jgi:hypothetical protein